jgi:hypothetical protein
VVKVGPRLELSVDVPQEEDVVEKLEEAGSRRSDEKGGFFGSGGDEYVESSEYVLRDDARVVLIGKITPRGESVTVTPVSRLPLVVQGTRAGLEKSLAANTKLGRWAMYTGLFVALVGAALLLASFVRAPKGGAGLGPPTNPARAGAENIE